MPLPTPLLNVIVDLSHHNTITSFEDARAAGVQAVIHKATEGVTFVDAMHDDRKARAKAAGLLWGAYHFGTGGDVIGQVAHFLSIANPAPGDLLVLDFEPNPTEQTMTLADAEEFVTRVKAATGRVPVLYSGRSFLMSQLGVNTTTPLAECPLWIARYAPEVGELPAAFSRFAIWQYTDGSAGLQPHQVDGLGRCDRNKFNGEDADALRTFWAGAGMPAPPTRGARTRGPRRRGLRQQMIAKQPRRRR
jgi:lysozyme